MVISYIPEQKSYQVCFVYLFSIGTRLRFHKGPNVEWQEVEDVAEYEEESDDEGGLHLNPIKVI